MKFFSLVLPSDPNVALTFIQFVVNIYGVVKKNSARKPQHMCLMIRNFDMTNGINMIRIKMAKYKQWLYIDQTQWETKRWILVDISRIFDISIALNYKFAGLRETVWAPDAFLLATYFLLEDNVNGW